MSKTLIVAGFIILFAGGLLYTLLPYTSFPCAWWSESPIGTAVMFAGFILMVVGLFRKTPMLNKRWRRALCGIVVSWVATFIVTVIHLKIISNIIGGYWIISYAIIVFCILAVLNYC